MQNICKILFSDAIAPDRDLHRVQWSETYQAKLRQLAAGETPGFSAVDKDLAPVLLLCNQGAFATAERDALDLMRANIDRAGQDEETLFSFLHAFFVLQRLDLVAAILKDKYGFERQLELGFEEGGIGIGCIRWEISPDRTHHRFLFDSANLRHDDTRTYILQFKWEFPLLAHYAARPNQEFGTVLLNQADVGSSPGLAYCDNRPDYFLIPDYIFVATGGYAYARQILHERRVRWEDKLPVAFWRGGTTGRPVITNDWRSLDRVRLCMIAGRAEPGELFDTGFSSILQIRDEAAVQWIKEAGLFRGPVPWEDWGRYRYLIDIDGNSSPWSNLFQKLLTGSPVLKVESRHGYAQWFYDDLIPWHNYVPISSDMSDLVDKVKWLARHDELARRIGEKGLDLAQYLTYGREMSRCVRVISAAFRYFRSENDDAGPFGRDDDRERLGFKSSGPETINVCRSGGLGDILLCTPALRALKAANPRKKLIFYGNYLDFLRGIPYIDDLRDYGDRPDHAITPAYEGRVSADRHIAEIFGEALGVTVADVRPDCAIDGTLMKRFFAMFGSLPRPWVVVNRRASVWTPNKDWPNSRWSELVASLKKRCGVIEIGLPPQETTPNDEKGHIDLVGKTTLAEVAAIIAAADIVVTPISGPAHIAAAARTPAVVIYGGYEPASATAYEGNENLVSVPECSPCWMREPCPFEKKCLTAISVSAVEAAIWRIWSGISPAHIDPTTAALDGHGSEPLNANELVSGPLAVPAVLDSSNHLYVAYRPDSEFVYHRYPELRAISKNWVNRNVLNNGGDLPRLYSLSMNVKQVLSEGVSGSLAELGVARGNSASVLAYYARIFGRTLYLFDTFSGVGIQEFSDEDPHKDLSYDDTSVEQVLGITGSVSVTCVKGRFPDSITPEMAAMRFAVVHLDCDLYKSTKAGLEFFYGRLSPGGILIVHDYVNEYWGGVKKAVDEFKKEIPEQFILMPDKSGTAILRKKGKLPESHALTAQAREYRL